MSAAKRKKIGKLPEVYEGTVVNFNSRNGLANLVCDNGVVFPFQGGTKDPLIHISVMKDPNKPKRARLPPELEESPDYVRVKAYVVMDAQGPVVQDVLDLNYDLALKIFTAPRVTGTLDTHHKDNKRLGSIKRDDNGRRIAVHASKVEGEKLPELGARLSFRVGPSLTPDGNPIALEVKIISSPSAQPTKRKPEGEIEGVILSLNRQKQFGFIKRDDGEGNLFFHRSDMDDSFAFLGLEEDKTRVRFRVVDSTQKVGEIRAAGVKVIAGAPAAKLDEKKLNPGAPEGVFKGTIKFVDEAKGFGWIRRDGEGLDVFFARYDKDDDLGVRHDLELSSLKPGTRVQFYLVPNTRKGKEGTFKAVGVEKIDTAPAAQIRPAGQEVSERRPDVREERPAAGPAHRDPKPPGRDGQT